MVLARVILLRYHWVLVQTLLAPTRIAMVWLIFLKRPWEPAQSTPTLMVIVLPTKWKLITGIILTAVVKCRSRQILPLNRLAGSSCKWRARDKFGMLIQQITNATLFPAIPPTLTMCWLHSVKALAMP